MKLILSIASMLAIFVSSVGAETLIGAPDAAVYVAPKDYTGYFVNRMGDYSVWAPNWHIAQWNNPDPFVGGVSYAAGPGQSWSFSNNSTRVQYYTTDAPWMIPGTYELAQSAADNFNPLPCGVEYDLFMETTGAAGYQTYDNVPAPYAFKTSAPLNQLSNIELQFGLRVQYEAIQSSRCPTTYAAYVIALTLNSSQGYGMFHQLFLRDSRPNTSANNTPCPGYPSNGTYCFDTTVDQLEGGPSMQDKFLPRVYYDLNTLASISRAIASTPDPDLSHWQVTGAYFGHVMQGSIDSVSQWDSINISAY